MLGEVRVVETNACAPGEPVTLDVEIHPLPTSAISGLTTVGENSTGNVYSVIENPGYTYSWNITGGTLASGDGTGSITVDWGAAGSGNVAVTATNTACGLSAAPVNLPVTIYAVITSIATGNFDQPGTWDCNCIPPSSSNIVIDSSHTVTLVGATTVNNLTIHATGTLDNAAADHLYQWQLYPERGTYRNWKCRMGSYLSGRERDHH